MHDPSHLILRRCSSVSHLRRCSICIGTCWMYWWTWTLAHMRMPPLPLRVGSGPIWTSAAFRPSWLSPPTGQESLEGINWWPLSFEKCGRAPRKMWLIPNMHLQPVTGIEMAWLSYISCVEAINLSTSCNVCSTPECCRPPRSARSTAPAAKRKWRNVAFSSLTISSFLWHLFFSLLYSCVHVAIASNALFVCKFLLSNQLVEREIVMMCDCEGNTPISLARSHLGPPVAFPLEYLLSTFTQEEVSYEHCTRTRTRTRNVSTLSLLWQSLLFSDNFFSSLTISSLLWQSLLFSSYNLFSSE